MAKFYLNINKQERKDGGHYEIHRDDKNCTWFNRCTNTRELYGAYSPQSALEIAEKKYGSLYYPIDGCATCCPEINSDN